MKVYLYSVYYSLDKDQKRIFILGEGVIGYENGTSIFFSDHKDLIIEAKEAIQEVNHSSHYIGMCELPDVSIKQVVSLGKTLNESKEEFDRTAQGLLKIIETQLNSSSR